MSANDLIASGDRSAERKSAGSALRRPTAWLAAVGVVVLLAAAFALSYDGFVALARAGGVSDRLARYYPVVYDAVVVVAFAAIFVLRTARVYVRLLAWLSAILVLGVCAAAAAIHAAEIHVPQKPLAAVVATMPFLMLVLAFRLWLTMLRHIRRLAAQRRQAVTRADQRGPEPALEPVPEREPAPARPRRHPEARAITPLALPAAAPSTAESEATATAPPAAPAPSAEEPAAHTPEPPEPEPELHEHDEHAEPEQAELEAPYGQEDDADNEEPFEPVHDLDGDRPPLPVRLRSESRRNPGMPAELADTGPLPLVPSAAIGDEDEFVADDGPVSDPVSDEAEADDTDAPAHTDDDVDEFAEFEADDAEDTDDAAGADDAVEEESTPEVPPPPSGRVRSSPLPPLDWGPGLGGLTGRRRTPRPRDDSENHAP